MNVGVSVKNEMIWILVNKGYMCNPIKCDCECNRSRKIDEYLDTKNCPCEKRLIGKLILECEDEIAYTNETLLNKKK